MKLQCPGTLEHHRIKIPSRPINLELFSNKGPIGAAHVKLNKEHRCHLTTISSSVENIVSMRADSAQRVQSSSADIILSKQ